MKRIRKSRAARILSWLLTVVMITPLLCGVIAPTAAHAQTPAAPGGVQTVIVIDFANKSGFNGDALARFATDAVAVELANSNRFEVLKRDEVQRTANELGVRAPYDQIALSKIAAQLGATAIVTGEIGFARANTKTSPKAFDVGLKVRIQEASTGDLLNGAAQVGEAKARPGQSDNDSLAQEATGNAAVLAVRQVLDFTLPEGTIINTVGGGNGPSLQVLINRGSRDGVQEGQQLIVLRDRQRVARIQVTTVYPTDSECKVVENFLGIRPEDKVRAVFPMPDFNVKTGEVIKNARRSGSSGTVGTLGKILLVALIGVVLVSALQGGQSSVTGVTAEATLQNAAPAVRIVWRDNLFGNGAQTLEYHVWRSPDAGFNFQGTPVAAVGGGVRTYTDLPAPFSYWDGIRGFLQAPTATNGGTTGGNGNASAVTPAALEVVGFTTGRTVSYQVSAIIRRPLVTGTSGGNGGTNGTEDVETSPMSSGPVTPINQPLLQSPLDAAANINLKSVNFVWLSRSGADEFQLEISTDRTFKNPNLIVRIPFISTAPNTEGVTQTLAQPLDLFSNGTLRKDPTFLNFVNQVTGATRPTLFWRVGARNSGDRPGPVHWISQRHDDPDRTFRFIYSNARSMTPADLPPPAP